MEIIKEPSKHSNKLTRSYTGIYIHTYIPSVQTSHKVTPQLYLKQSCEHNCNVIDIILHLNHCIHVCALHALKEQSCIASGAIQQISLASPQQTSLSLSCLAKLKYIFKNLLMPIRMLQYEIYVYDPQAGQIYS